MVRDHSVIRVRNVGITENIALKKQMSCENVKRISFCDVTIDIKRRVLKVSILEFYIVVRNLVVISLRSF